MTCSSPLSGVVVCASPQGIVRRIVLRCPTCQTRRRMVVTWQGSWYGEHLSCLTCGDTWGDGERLERPFVRGWKQRAIAKHRQKWANALSPREYRRVTRAEVRAEMEPRTYPEEPECLTPS